MRRDKKREEAIDRGKLTLSYLKERDAYREFFKEKSKALTVALKRYREWYEQERHKSIDCTLEAMSEDSRVFNDFWRECENRFGIANPPLMVNISVDDVLLFLDPEKNIEDIPKEIESIFADMFSPERITQVANDGVPLGALMHEWARVALLLPEKIEPYQRLLLVDMRGGSASLKKRFAEYLDSVKRTRGSQCLQDDFREDWHTYDNWTPDNSRGRAEGWQHLKAWKHRRLKKGFPYISREMGISPDRAKKSFYRAYELIEGHKYDPIIFRKLYRKIGKEDISRSCGKCSDSIRKACGATGTLCPEVLAFVSQDYVRLQEKLLPPEAVDFIGSSDPRPARSTPRKKTE